MTLAEWIAETRRLAADPENLPPVPEGEEPQAADPPPRWSRADLLRVGQSVLDSLAGKAPRAFQTGDAYVDLNDSPPLLLDDDAQDLRLLGISALGQAVAHLAAASLLVEIQDKYSQDAAAGNRAAGMALLEGYVDA